MRHLRRPEVSLKQEIKAVYRSAPVIGGEQVDLLDFGKVEALFNRYGITAVINLAAEARPAICQVDAKAATAGNITIVKNLLKACSASGCYFVHASTDMVFKGNKPLYFEQDIPDPISVYGRVKAEAEALVQQYRGPWCVVRPALIYGSEIDNRSSFLSWMLQSLEQGTGKFFTDERRSPVYVGDLVRLLLEVVTARQTGILHCGGLECLSRVEFAQIAADVWNYSHSNITTTSLAANPDNSWRPKSVCLSSDTAHSLVRFTEIRAALEQIRISTLERTAGGHQ